jgi:multidrug efflux pump subunit AcrB
MPCANSLPELSCMPGIVGQNSIFVLHEARLELRAGRSVAEAWELAAVRRLRPGAMTVLATAFALAPWHWLSAPARRSCSPSPAR